MDDRESHLLAVMHVCGFDAKPADAALILDQLAIPALDRSWEALADRNGKLAARIVALEAERDRLREFLLSLDDDVCDLVSGQDTWGGAPDMEAFQRRVQRAANRLLDRLRTGPAVGSTDSSTP